jgi:uncharacterized protein YndB with AHSA1/START domain
MNDSLIVKKIIRINADKSKVWDVLVNPEKIKLYLFGTETISDWKVGSPIIFQGQWEGKSYKDKGNIIQLKPFELFQYNYWSSFSSTEDKPENYSTITFKLAEENGSTILTLIQEPFLTEVQRDHSDKNWEMVLGLIKQIVEK